MKIINKNAWKNWTKMGKNGNQKLMVKNGQKWKKKKKKNWKQLKQDKSNIWHNWKVGQNCKLDKIEKKNGLNRKLENIQK